MRPPFCDWETLTCEYQDFAGGTRSEQIAVPTECGHSHDYLDFRKTLQGLWPDLHFGFDRRKDRYVVFRYTPEIIELDKIDGVKLRWVRRYIDIVLEMKWGEIIQTKFGGKRMIFTNRRFGNWVFEELAKFDPRRHTNDMSWVGEHLDKMVDDREEAQQAKLRKNSEDMVADMMTLSDRGNPWFRKRQFRQRRLRAGHPKLKGAVA